METLEPLRSIQRLSDRVLRILGQNPGKMTLQGTNTYLLGRRPPFMLLDTGEGKDEYIPLLEYVLIESVSQHTASPMISDVIISHDHHDHWGGLPQVLSLLRKLWETKHSSYPFVPPRVHKATGSLSNELGLLLAKIDKQDYLPTPGQGILHDMFDGQILKGSDTEVQVLLTPGHTEDSICIIVKEESSLFTADTVLGSGTAVFTNLTQYMESLKRLSGLEEQFKTLYPGHGPVVEDGPAKIREYIHHRQDREDEILRVLSSKPPGTQGWKAMDIVAVIYATYPRKLWEWAGRLVVLHLEKLEHDGKVIRGPNETWGVV